MLPAILDLKLIEREVEDLSKKTAQAIRIRAKIIERNNAAIALTRSLKKEIRQQGFELLIRNWQLDTKFYAIAKKGAEEGIKITARLLAVMPTIGFKKSAIDVVKSLQKIFSKSIEYYSSIIEKRLEFESKYLNEKKFWKKRYFAYRFKRLWRKERLQDAKIYRMINIKKLNNDISTFNKVKEISKTLGKETARGVVDNTLAAVIAAYPSAGAAYAFASIFTSMDEVEKAALASAVWAVSGFLARICQASIELKQTFELAMVNYNLDSIKDIEKIFPEEAQS